MLRPTLAIAAIALAIGTPEIGAWVKRYMPLDDSELALRFPQRVVNGNFTQFLSARIGATSVRFLESADEIQFKGKDISGKPWTITADAMRGGGLYSADLDHNGAVDLIYASYTGGNGWAPSMHILTLLFDDKGRPVPSEMDGYFEIDPHGLRDLVDLDRDGRAELIRQSYDDGYWVTSLYTAQDAHWRLIHAEHAGRRYPIYTRFTNRFNRVAVDPAPERHPIEDDLANAFDAGGKAVVITKMEWRDMQQSENVVLHLSDGRRCEVATWYSTASVVLDAPEGRVAATFGAPDIARRLLETMVRRRIPVQISGKRRSGEGEPECMPEMLWADDISLAR